MEPEVHIKKVPRTEKVSCKYIFIVNFKTELHIHIIVVSSLVLVSLLLTLGTGDVAVGPASDTVVRAITS